MQETYATLPEAAPQELTLEELKTLNNLEVGVEGDFSVTLAEINKELGVQLESRPEGFHITVIGPTEKKILDTLTVEQFKELQTINAKIQRGEGIALQGIGFIDGAVAAVRIADKGKKTCFVAFDIPELNMFRRKLGLKEKDFHITLGFVNGDVHMEVTGKDVKGKDILGPITKKADPNFDKYKATLPSVHYGALGGPKKQEKQENKK